MTDSALQSLNESAGARVIRKPVLLAVLLCLSVILARVVGRLVFNLDQLTDPLILCRVLVCSVALACLAALRQPFSAIGYHRRGIGTALLVGAVAPSLVYLVLYGIQAALLTSRGAAPQLIFSALSKDQSGYIGALATALPVVGQFVNAFGEEAVFRGLTLPILMQRYGFWKANILQALFFGLAHLILPFADYVHGSATGSQALADALSLLLFATVGGLVFGYLYYRTGSLWTPTLLHLIDNAVGRYFHLATKNTLTGESGILIFGSLGLLLACVLAWLVYRRGGTSVLKSWGQATARPGG